MFKFAIIATALATTLATGSAFAAAHAKAERKGQFSVITRTDGSKQWTVNGMALTMPKTARERHS
ncbi:hypothetical protein [Profundibacter sp.]